MNQPNLSNKTIFQFNLLKNNSTDVLAFTIILFSMAGVPPFLGFFTKLIILICLTNANLFILYITFFILLFFSLYFYLQNLRFLYSTTSTPSLALFTFIQRIPIIYIYFLFLFIIILSVGFIFFEDFLLYIQWLYS